MAAILVAGELMDGTHVGEAFGRGEKVGFADSTNDVGGDRKREQRNGKYSRGE
jgi:hypothetical protein